MDDAANGKRMAPLSDDLASHRYPDPADGNGNSNGKSSAPGDGLVPLTHRPRNLATLPSAALKPVAGREPGRSFAAQTRDLHDSDAVINSDRVGPDPIGSDLAGSELVAPDLRPFADQLIAIAERLRSGNFGDFATVHAQDINHGENGAAHYRTVTAPPASNGAANSDLAALDPVQRRQIFAEMARVAYAKRRKRTTIFGDPELFGEPAWDILLDLYIAQVENKSVSVSSACIGSAAPPTTGLRWLGVLADHGMVEREHDPLDQRRVLVRLSQKALDAMDDYFTSSAALQTDRRTARR